ncbi:alpha/beta hydrolase [Geothrix edaphica]|uniref:Phospholipase/carboxylesterase n=1 Tax=Geothrix edaphica TaxID=2927976 RepID=A0ABQ5Q038_9BACT|nr:alpha/beta hydrolase-fold protein [Geothrix edaphica]GLH67996.1 phospholipase/carboxylesterase [Geothrix edaphica]
MASPAPFPGVLQQDASSGLSYRVMQPPPTQPRALVVLLHGVGGQETDLAELAAGVAPGVLVVLVRSRLELGPQQFGWFRVAFTAEGPKIEENEAEASRHALIRLVDHLQSQYSIEARRTVLAGFSQGGILSASVALTAPERVGGFAILSGRILPELEPRVAGREWLAHLRGFIGHGEQDRTLPLAWAQRADSLLDDLGIPHVTRVYPAGHTLNPEMRADVLAWIGGLSGAA